MRYSFYLANRSSPCLFGFVDSISSKSVVYLSFRFVRWSVISRPHSDILDGRIARLTSKLADLANHSEDELSVYVSSVCVCLFHRYVPSMCMSHPHVYPLCMYVPSVCMSPQRVCPFIEVPLSCICYFVRLFLHVYPYICLLRLSSRHCVSVSSFVVSCVSAFSSVARLLRSNETVTKS